MNGRGNGPVTAAHNVRKPVYHTYTLIKVTHPLSSGYFESGLRRTKFSSPIYIGLIT